MVTLAEKLNFRGLLNEGVLAKLDDRRYYYFSTPTGAVVETLSGIRKITHEERLMGKQVYIDGPYTREEAEQLKNRRLE